MPPRARLAHGLLPPPAGYRRCSGRRCRISALAARRRLPPRPAAAAGAAPPPPARPPRRRTAPAGRLKLALRSSHASPRLAPPHLCLAANQKPRRFLKGTGGAARRVRKRAL